MSERGVFAVDRGIWDHPSFDDEPFTQREAWQWLISEASFRDRSKRVGGTLVQLKRGQVAASLRFMADKWKWSEPRVRRFLLRLKTDAMVTGETTQGITILTICNYNKYQKVSLPRDAVDDAPADAAATQQRRKVESTESTEVVDDGGSRAKSTFTEGSKVLADALWKALGFASPLDITPQYAGTDWRAVEWERAGWTPEIITAEVARAGPNKPLSYYEKCFATAHAKLNAPLPKVEIREAEKVLIHAPSRSNGSVAAAFREIREQMQSGSGDEAGGNVVLRISSC